MFYCVGVSPRQAHKNYNFPAVSFRPTKRVFVILNEVKNLDLHAIRSFAGAQDDICWGSGRPIAKHTKLRFSQFF